VGSGGRGGEGRPVAEAKRVVRSDREWFGEYGGREVDCSPL